jgi:hypothetical protein
MLHDVFICHASEDKDVFVRPLADALRAENTEVWYDEFTLQLGDSIRQSIDRGLRQSRFGVIVLSKAFFEKQWPQYELDGLVEREMRGEDRVLLPVWHDVDHDEVMKYSPPLAGRKAALSSTGIEKVVQEIVGVIRPQGSPLIVARDLLLRHGITPPVITDEYWLDVVEASNRGPAYGAHIPENTMWGRWSFPLPAGGPTPADRGMLLAWTAMQMAWVEDALDRAMTPLTHPEEVLRFVNSHPGLVEACIDNPDLVVEWAPQLAIPGFGGVLEESLEGAFRASCAKSASYTHGNPKHGLFLTVNASSPLCEEEWSIRHPAFGNYRPQTVASYYFGGTMFGPTVSPYEDADHLFWLLSSASAWLPRRVHKVLLDGMASWVTWVWHDRRNEPGPTRGDAALSTALWNAQQGKRKFRWSLAVEEDVRKRMQHAISQLKLPESIDQLLETFLAHDLPRRYLAAQREIARSRNEKAHVARRGKARK